jgi:plasmid stability protein
MNELSYVLWLPEDLHTALKTYAASHHATMREVICAALKNYMTEDHYESRDDLAKPNSN